MPVVAVVLLVGMVVTVVTVEVLALQDHLAPDKIVEQVAQNTMMVICQQLASCHQEKLVVR